MASAGEVLAGSCGYCGPRIVQNAPMLQTLRRHALWILAWCALAALGCVGLARMELAQLRDKGVLTLPKAAP